MVRCAQGEIAMIFGGEVLLLWRQKLLEVRILKEGCDRKVADCGVNCKVWERLVVARNGNWKMPGQDQISRRPWQ